jgi:hypothetical protein
MYLPILGHECYNGIVQAEACLFIYMGGLSVPWGGKWPHHAS